MVNNGYLIHREPHPMKGKPFTYAGMGYTILDWYDRQTKRKFMDEYGNDRVTKGYRNMVVLERAKGNTVPVDEEVVLAVSSQGVSAFHHTQVMKGK